MPGVDDRLHPFLGPYGDWIEHATRRGNLYPAGGRPGLTGEEVLDLKFDRAMQASAFSHLARWLPRADHVPETW